MSRSCQRIDGQAHRSTLDQHTITVIGCGLDVVYPKEHASLYAVMRKKQLIISDIQTEQSPMRTTFHSEIGLSPH